MAAFTGRALKNWFKDILQVSNSNSGIDATLRAVSDGEGTDSALSLSSGKAKITGSLAAASGNEVALQLDYTTNKAAGDDTGLQITQTDTVSGGTSYLINALVATSSKFNVGNSGRVTIAEGLWPSDAAGPILKGLGAPTGGPAGIRSFAASYSGNTTEAYMGSYMLYSDGNVTVRAATTAPSSGLVKVTDGSATGQADLQAGGMLTAGSLATAPVVNGYVRSAVYKVPWTNADVAGLAGTTGSIVVATLPAATKVENAYVVITGAAAGPATVTVSLGRTGAGYIDYIVASDAKAAANTIYGNDSAERGTNLTGYDLPSWTATTAVYVQFVSGGADLSTVTASTGYVVLETTRLIGAVGGS